MISASDNVKFLPCMKLHGKNNLSYKSQLAKLSLDLKMPLILDFHKHFEAIKKIQDIQYIYMYKSFHNKKIIHSQN